MLQRIPTAQAGVVATCFIDFEDAHPLKVTHKTKKVSVNPKPNKVPDITENGATRLMAALAGDTIREALDGKGDVQLAKKSLQLLLNIIADAVPSI